MTNDPAAISTKLVERGEDWADKEHGASMLEETRKPVRAQLAVKYFEQASSAAKAELLAEADPTYLEHIQKMVDARKAANIARVNYDAARSYIDLVRTTEASNRAAMNMR